jgi:glycine betaine/proline transport system substrate-binding protein
MFNLSINRGRYMKAVTSWVLVWLLSLSGMADASSESECKTVRIGVVDWTDLHVVNGIAKELLEELGYQVELNTQPATPELFQQMQSANIDVFMGYWTPAMAEIAAPFYGQKAVSTLTANLHEARWTLAVPDYVYDQGVHDFADLVRFRDKFEDRIYGLEKGSSGNAAILDMINTNAFGLKDFKLIETSERLMLAQVKGKVRKGEWIVFMGWQPHPMNQHFSLRYLSGGDKYFGPEYGKATVNTSVRQGLTNNCPNLARFLNNLTFVASVEEEIMDQVSNGFVPVDRAVRMWMHKNPEQVSRWLAGVTRLNGQPVDPAAMAEKMEVTFGR